MRRPVLAAAGGLALALAMTPAMADSHEATVSVLHGVPDLTVDVYIDGEPTLPSFAPGTLTDPISLAAGAYDVEIYAEGADPDTDDPALSANDLEVPGGANLTLVAHLDASGSPTLGAFVNDVSPTAAGDARLTVRHVAAAPEVDVRAGGTPVIEGLANPDEETLDLPAGTVSADVVAAGTDQVVLGPADVNLAEGTNTIVYAWGSLDDDNLDLAVQVIDGLHSDPGGVPTGELMAPGVPLWAWVLTAAGVLGVAAAVRRRSATPVSSS